MKFFGRDSLAAAPPHAQNFTRQAGAFWSVLFGVMVVFLGIEYVDNRVNEATQAYLEGVDRWGEARQAATHHLERFIRTGAPKERRQFQAALQVPLSFRSARRAFQQSNPDPIRLRAHLIPNAEDHYAVEAIRNSRAVLTR